MTAALRLSGPWETIEREARTGLLCIADAVALVDYARRTQTLEQAAISYVYARRDFDSVPFMVRQRYKFGPWKTYAKAWCRLEAAAKDAEKATTE